MLESSVARRAAALALFLLLAGCGGTGPAPDGAGGAEGFHHPMVGKAAPDFVGEAPVGGWLPLSNLKGKPVAILIFRPGSPFARELVTAFGAFRNDPAMSPTVFLGVAVAGMEEMKRFGEQTGGALPTVRDPGTIAPAYEVGEEPSIILIDARRFVRFRMDGFAGARFRPAMQAVAEALRRLPGMTALDAPDLRIEYARYPRAPQFTARDLDGRTVDLGALRGSVVVLMFFDQECVHCQRDMPRLAPVLRDLRPRVRAIGVSSRDAGGNMRAFLRQHGVDWPVIIDTDRAIFTSYSSTGTPDLFIIDGDGFIRFRERGDRPDRAEVTRLQARLALGDPPEALAATLPRGRFVGDGLCAACHRREYDDWLMTPHSIAWDSLASGDKWRERECVACHVTGIGSPGGFVDPETTLHMANVQCEVCHGMAGGHPEGQGLDPVRLANVCETCHTGKFVLNFSIDEALPLVAHQDTPDLDRLFRYSGEQRQRIEQMKTRRLEKFKSGVAHVGADACRDCHRTQYEQWRRTPHAGAMAVLFKAGRGGDPACIPCHSTGFGQARGFGDERAQVAMTGVQCEVCHGPGADHVTAPPALKKTTIYGITDQCSFCIIQGVCATCHDAKNDPDFAIETALPKVQH
jgi:peroxiredoxin